MADYIAKGPTADEVQRAVMSEVSGRIRGLEQVGGFGGKAVSLAEGQTYAHDSDFYKKTLASYAAITPAAVRAAMQQWLRRPALTIILSPGERDGLCRSEGGRRRAKPGRQDRRRGQGQPARFRRSASSRRSISRRSPTRTLSNGIPVDYAQRDGGAGDPGRAGVRRRRRRRRADTRAALPAMTMDLLDEGTSKLTSQQLAEAEERLGADVSTSNGGRPVVRHAVRAVAEPRAVARPAGRRRPKDAAFRPDDIDRVRAADADRHRADAEGPDARRAAAAAGGAVRRQPSLRRARRAAIRKAIAKFTRDDLVALPAALAAARQCQDLHRFGPAAEPKSSRCSRRASATGRRRRSPRASRTSPRRRRARPRRRSC